MLDKNLNIKIGDFGVSKRIDEINPSFFKGGGEKYDVLFLAYVLYLMQFKKQPKKITAKDY